MYQYTEFDRQFVRTRAAQYRDQLERFLGGQLDAEAAARLTRSAESYVRNWQRYARGLTPL